MTRLAAPATFLALVAAVVWHPPEREVPPWWWPVVCGEVARGVEREVARAA